MTPETHTITVSDVPVTTSDRAAVRVDASVGFRILDAARPADSRDVMASLTARALAVAVSEMSLSELLEEQATVSRRVRSQLETESDAWGLQIAEVLFEGVDVPDEIVRQLQAKEESERRRRERIVENESGD